MQKQTSYYVDGIANCEENFQTSRNYWPKASSQHTLTFVLDKGETRIDLLLGISFDVQREF